MNTDQNTRHIYKTEDIDWDGLKAAGISKKQLEAEGNMELLLQGKETGIVPLKLHISVLSLTMDATLKLVPDGQRQTGYGNKRSPSEGGGGSLTGKQ